METSKGHTYDEVNSSNNSSMPLGQDAKFGRNASYSPLGAGTTTDMIRPAQDDVIQAHGRPLPHTTNDSCCPSPCLKMFPCCLGVRCHDMKSPKIICLGITVAVLLLLAILLPILFVTILSGKPDGHVSPARISDTTTILQTTTTSQLLETTTAQVPQYEIPARIKVEMVPLPRYGNTTFEDLMTRVLPALIQAPTRRRRQADTLVAETSDDHDHDHDAHAEPTVEVDPATTPEADSSEPQAEHSDETEAVNALFGEEPLSTVEPTPIEESSTVDSVLVLDSIDDEATVRVLRESPDQTQKGSQLIADDLREAVTTSGLHSALCLVHGCSEATLDSVTLNGNEMEMAVTLKIKAGEEGIHVMGSEVDKSKESIARSIQEELDNRYSLFFQVQSVDIELSDVCEVEGVHCMVEEPTPYVPQPPRPVTASPAFRITEGSVGSVFVDIGETVAAITHAKATEPYSPEPPMPMNAVPVRRRS